jgi:hypothetical protein
MDNFVQATGSDVHMYEKFKDFTFLCILVIKYSKVWVIGIFYETIKHKMGFGQAYCQDLLTRIPEKFISYFYELYFIFYVF